MQIHSLTTQRTARYVQEGSITSSTKGIWFLLHGYMQCADAFLQSFSPLFRNDYVFIAPEALSRAYIRGSNGEVGASWMTRLEREAEIRDYLTYLNTLLSIITDGHPSIPVSVLGFSQGASTMARWLTLGNLEAKNVVFYSGAPPKDAAIDWNNSSSYHVIHESEPEEWMKPYVKPFQSFLEQLPSSVYKFRYIGGHQIHPNALAYLETLL